MSTRLVPGVKRPVRQDEVADSREGDDAGVRGVVPRKGLLDANWKYVSASRTNLHVTFARIRKEMAAKAKPTNVKALPKKEKKA